MKRKKSLIRLISNIYRNSQAYIVPNIAEYDIGRGQWYFLNKLLLDRDGMSQEELSKEMVVDSSHTTRAIKDLEKKGYVYREKDPNDNRKNNVFVTEKALDIKDEYHNIYRQLNGILIKGFTNEEKETLTSLLFKMEDNIKSYIDDENKNK